VQGGLVAGDLPHKFGLLGGIKLHGFSLNNAGISQMLTDLF
jgi:hypothetical protein